MTFDHDAYLKRFIADKIKAVLCSIKNETTTARQDMVILTTIFTPLQNHEKFCHFIVTRFLRWYLTANTVPWLQLNAVLVVLHCPSTLVRSESIAPLLPPMMTLLTDICLQVLEEELSLTRGLLYKALVELVTTLFNCSVLEGSLN
jgi:hypothetical protein